MTIENELWLTTVDQRAKLKELHDFAEEQLKRVKDGPFDEDMVATLQGLHDYTAERLEDHS